MLTRDAIKKQVRTNMLFTTDVLKIIQGAKYNRFEDKETKNQKGKTLKINSFQCTNHCTLLSYIFLQYSIFIIIHFSKPVFRMSRILARLRKPTQLFRLRQYSDYVGPFLVQTDKGAIYQPGMNMNNNCNIKLIMFVI